MVVKEREVGGFIRRSLQEERILLLGFRLGGLAHPANGLLWDPSTKEEDLKLLGNGRCHIEMEHPADVKISCGIS